MGKNGPIFVISGPSGAGKDTVRQLLLKKHPGRLVALPTYTTRPPRAGEEEGREYFFIDENSFQNKIKEGEIVEHNRYGKADYGTSRRAVEKAITEGLVPILILDVNGAKALKGIFPLVCTIFLDVTLEDLTERLKKRGVNTAGEQSARLAIARGELARKNTLDHIVANPQNHLAETVDRINAIIQGELASKG